jgi:transcriptional regulator with XRE-family HTH domain
MSGMAGKKLELGPIGAVVADNVTRYRETARFNYTELSKELEKHGRDISALAVRRIEEGNRRVDVDDLVALALSLNVSPLALLLPRTESAVTITGESIAAERIWHWAKGEQPLDGELNPEATAAWAFVINSNPFADWAQMLRLPDELSEQFNSSMRQALSEATISADGIELRDGNLGLNFKSHESRSNDGDD